VLSQLDSLLLARSIGLKAIGLNPEEK